MARIIPGYSFGTNEIPFRATIFQMLEGMSIAAISPALINASLVGMNWGASATTLPAEGWMWADNAGSIWVQTTNGAAKLWRAQGGWSTNRFPVLGAIDTIIPPMSPSISRAILRNRISNGGNTFDTNESNVGWFGTADQSGAPIGKCEDTMVSGLNIRWVVRGGAVWELAAASDMMPGLVRRHTSSGQQTVEMDQVPTTNAESRNNTYYGLSARGFSQAVPNTRTGWLFGGILRVY